MAWEASTWLLSLKHLIGLNLRATNHGHSRNFAASRLDRNPLGSKHIRHPQYSDFEVPAGPFGRGILAENLFELKQRVANSTVLGPTLTIR